MDVDRLKQAIEIIENVPGGKLDLRVWQQRTVISHSEFGYVKNIEQANCGTIACAAGWLALDPDMQRQGLKVGQWGQPIYCDETGEIFLEFVALQRFFDLRDIEADRLFGSRTWQENTHTPTLTDKQIWIQRARNLLEREQNER